MMRSPSCAIKQNNSVLNKATSFDVRRKELIRNSYCEKVLFNNPEAVRRAKDLQRKTTYDQLVKRDLDTTEYLKKMAEESCEDFRMERGYLTVPISTEERNFPIAFSILMYKHVSQVERLLRALYSPSNFYCFHIDSKASVLIHDAMHAIASCFRNIYIVPNPISVHWGDITLIEAERLCIRHLVRRSKKWRYFINLTGEEFPLWSNRHLVRILKAYNGTNDLHYSPDLRKDRYQSVWINGKRHGKKEPPPRELKMVRGEIHVIATRGFAELVVDPKNKLVARFHNWARNILIPDEFYYTVLHFNEKVLKTPGGIPSKLVIDSRKFSLHVSTVFQRKFAIEE